MTNSQEPIRSANGTDITEAVQIIYDMAHNSMDWGSGFLSTEEIHTVIKLAIHMGWKLPDLHGGYYGPGVAVAHQYPSNYEVTFEACKYAADGLWYTVKTKS